MKLKEAKQKYVSTHPLGKLTIPALEEKAKKEDVFVFGGKAQILQCFDQHRQMTKLYQANR